MKIVIALITLVLLGGTVATAQWKKGDERIPDTPDRKSVSGFGAHLLIVEDPRAFIEEWQKPETPKINPASNFRRVSFMSPYYSATTEISRQMSGITQSVVGFL